MPSLGVVGGEAEQMSPTLYVPGGTRQVMRLAAAALELALVEEADVEADEADHVRGVLRARSRLDATVRL